MKATIVLTPPAAKCLIAKGVAATKQVRRALSEGTVVITLGTTTGRVAEEILGRPIDRNSFAAGFINDRWNVCRQRELTTEIVLYKGKPDSSHHRPVIDSLTAGDVIIKGGNALDPDGTVGVLLGSDTGGTVGKYLSAALARGIEFIIPIGLEKAVHSSISEVSTRLGSGRIDLSTGIRCGIQPITGTVITEIEALETLFAVNATHVASGGIRRGAGSVSLLVEGDEEAVRSAFKLVESLSEEREPRLEGKV